uniref:ATPase AAA-type core domain-containing protein n=1 Tax=viral metagenome TaxID=1070528 RepID=A0A6C0I9E1_9ZZZZ
MVKLQFNPGPSKEVPESKCSKKVEVSLNPFEAENIEPSTLNNYIRTKDLVGLENTRYILNEWYRKSLLDKCNKFLLIIGPTGCGKTTLVESFCIEESIQLYSVRNDLSKKELLKEIIQFSNNRQNFFEKKSTSKLILIDEYQNGQHDTLSITDIENLFEFRKKFSPKTNVFEDFTTNVNIPPVLIISGDSKGNKLSELKKLTQTYYINELNKYVIKSWITKETDIDSSTLETVINKCGSDKRLLLNTIKFLKNKVGNYLCSFYKDTELNQFEFIERLFDNLEQINILEVYKNYETDGYLLSNLVHENYIDYTNDIYNIADAANSMSLADTYQTDMYDSTKIFFPEIHCTLSVYVPSYYARSNIKNNKCQLRSSVFNNRYNIFLNNKKAIIKINELLKHKELPLSILDILFIKKFLTYDLIKSKTLSKYQIDFLQDILGLFVDHKVSSMELIYKHFTDFKGTDQTKTKKFTLKFIEKIKY